MNGAGEIDTARQRVTHRPTDGWVAYAAARADVTHTGRSAAGRPRKPAQVRPQAGGSASALPATRGWRKGRVMAEGSGAGRWR
jgi:hypothetical protein